jgi:hypothetical protein
VSARRPARSRWGALAGGAIAIVYVTVAALTSGLSGRPTLPLFEGTGPPAPYQWVEPPCDFKTGNVVPQPTSAVIPMNAQGNEIGSVTQPGSQAIVTPQAGAIPPHPGAKSVTLRLEPIGPSTIGALPGQAVPDGNAYRLTITYDDGTPVTKFVKPVDYLIRAPTLADGGVFLQPGAGAAWQKQNTLTTPQPSHYPFETTLIGTFVAATAEPVFKGGVCSHGSGSGSPVVAIVIAVVAALLIVGVVLFVVYRRRAAAAIKPAPRRTPPPAKKRPR